MGAVIVIRQCSKHTDKRMQTAIRTLTQEDSIHTVAHRQAKSVTWSETEAHTKTHIESGEWCREMEAEVRIASRHIGRPIDT